MKELKDNIKALVESHQQMKKQAVRAKTYNPTASRVCNRLKGLEGGAVR